MNGLIDTSALIWILRHPDDDEALASAIVAGDVAICEPVVLEMLRGADSKADHDLMTRSLTALPLAPITPATFRHAHRVQRALAGQAGPRHRSVAVTDLLVAGAAIDAELPVLHRDRDYEAIASVTGQPQRWVGPPA